MARYVGMITVVVIFIILVAFAAVAECMQDYDDE